MSTAVISGQSALSATQMESGCNVGDLSHLRGLMAPSKSHTSKSFTAKHMPLGDVFLLFFELMKLEINCQELEKQSRQAERQSQLQCMQKEINSLKGQAKSLLLINIGAGAVGVISAGFPIIGHMGGKGILNFASNIPFLSGLKDMNPRTAFDAGAKMGAAMSETQRAMSQVMSSNAQATQTRYSTTGRNHETDHREKSDRLQQIQERFRELKQAIEELLRKDAEAASQLYR
ncbi:MAG: hypothetical protein S4CHLAM45_08850 [Chlamydiales bacterium]|nr:hypothetical protein [Chlamydiales bacterium]MCH9620365.1 hypothetical protein [Chlamydiales bacterium]MCH9622989.1 hypothetical protein [Chlamydiales bacterium]